MTHPSNILFQQSHSSVIHFLQPHLMLYSLYKCMRQYAACIKSAAICSSIIVAPPVAFVVPVFNRWAGFCWVHWAIMCNNHRVVLFKRVEPHSSQLSSKYDLDQFVSDTISSSLEKFLVDRKPFFFKKKKSIKNPKSKIFSTVIIKSRAQYVQIFFGFLPRIISYLLYTTTYSTYFPNRPCCPEEGGGSFIFFFWISCPPPLLPIHNEYYYSWERIRKPSPPPGLKREEERRDIDVSPHAHVLRVFFRA